MKWSSFSLAALCCLALAGCRRPVERIEWPVMGTVAAVQVRGGGGLSASCYRQSAADAFAEVERLLNAHNPDSELSRLAPLGNDAVLAQCDARVRPCYAAAFALERLSGGAFSPRWRGANTLDLGAIAKGFAVDLAAELTYVDGNDALLDLGGNLKAIQGEGGSRRPWRTGVRDPGGDGFAAEVDLREGEALATSATYRLGHGACALGDVGGRTLHCAFRAGTGRRRGAAACRGGEVSRSRRRRRAVAPFRRHLPPLRPFLLPLSPPLTRRKCFSVQQPVTSSQ